MKVDKLTCGMERKTTGVALLFCWQMRRSSSHDARGAVNGSSAQEQGGRGEQKGIAENEKMRGEGRALHNAGDHRWE